jgi:monoterpene epsilon-lactone hydrolase
MRRLVAVLCGALLVVGTLGACRQASSSSGVSDRVAEASAAEPAAQVLVAGVTSEQFSSASSSSDVQVLFLHGGSYVHEASALHAPFFDELLRAVHATITMPVYALAPENGYRVAYAQVQDVYLELRRRHPDSPIVLMGGSAGGGFALGFAQHLLEEGLPQPDRLVLISPWLDLTLANPAIPALDRVDVLLDRDALLPNGIAWAHGDDPRGYLLSPINGTLTGVAPTTVLAGTNDILYPDALLLKSKAFAAGLDLNFHGFEGADHVFAMSAGTAGDQARDIIKGVLASPDRD